MSKKNVMLHTEVKREAIQSIIFPFTLAFVIAIIIYFSPMILGFNLIQEELQNVFWLWVVITMIAGLLSLFISYRIIVRKEKNRQHGRYRG